MVDASRAWQIASPKLPVQKPLTAGEAAEEPVPLAGLGFDAVVIAADAGTAKPAALDAFRPGAIGDDVLLARPAERNRGAIGRQCQYIEQGRRREEQQRAVQGRVAGGRSSASLPLFDR